MSVVATETLIKPHGGTLSIAPASGRTTSTRSRS